MGVCNRRLLFYFPSCSTLTGVYFKATMAPLGNYYALNSLTSKNLLQPFSCRRFSILSITLLLVEQFHIVKPHNALCAARKVVTQA